MFTVILRFCEIQKNSADFMASRMYCKAQKDKKLKDNLQMTWVELISGRSKDDNGDKNTANQKACD